MGLKYQEKVGGHTIGGYRELGEEDKLVDDTGK